MPVKMSKYRNQQAFAKTIMMLEQNHDFQVIISLLKLLTLDNNCSSYSFAITFSVTMYYT